MVRIESQADRVLLPMLALSALAFVQTLSLGSSKRSFGTRSVPIHYQTRFFALQMLALTAFLALLYR